MSPRVWQEIGHVFSEIVPAEADCRCVILTGAGKFSVQVLNLQVQIRLVVAMEENVLTVHKELLPL